MNKTVKEVVKEYLTTNGYDGLAGDYCVCSLGDLMICDEDIGDCVVGYKHLMTQEYSDWLSENDPENVESEVPVGEYFISTRKDIKYKETNNGN